MSTMLKMNVFLMLLLCACAGKKEKVHDFYIEIGSFGLFESLHSSPPKSNYGEVLSIKVIYDFVHDSIYYLNSKKFPSHYEFAIKYLGEKKNAENFFYDQCGTNSNRSMYLITINYHQNQDKYVFEFSAYDQLDCQGISKAFQKLKATSFFGDKLVFHANNSDWENCTGVPQISSDELFSGQHYQALNTGENYGYLRKIDQKKLISANIKKHDLVLVNCIPNQLPVVSGIICTEFQNVLSHINILSHNRNTPNMSLKNAWSDPELDQFENKLVYLKVSANSYTIRKADLKEAEKFWKKRETQHIWKFENDTRFNLIIDAQNSGQARVNNIGGKAFHFFELQQLKTVPLPENAFAIPFHHYQHHLEHHHIDREITNMLSDPFIYTDYAYCDKKLKRIRELILEAELDPELRKLVLGKMNQFKSFTAFRFRSSTNAEDLDFFSGAGLYDSHTAQKNNPEKTIDNAIKRVWASLWNSRAFQEREYYGMDQGSVLMGILVHRAFPNEDANGVVVTKNLYNVNHGYTINVQDRETSTVSPKSGVLCDQLLMYTINLKTNKYTIEYLSHSNSSTLKTKSVLSEQELIELADYCTRIKKHFYRQFSSAVSYDDFALDIEFKLDSQLEKRKIYIKQVRLYQNTVP